MANINISDITSSESEKSEELDLIADSKDYLKELSEQEEANIYGGRWTDLFGFGQIWVY